tara:strand:+ start:254 stop:418 length:165 start_codon:yes stop_codon:yes gene_type:complete
MSIIGTESNDEFEFYEYKAILIGDEDSCKSELFSKYFDKPIEDMNKTDNGLFAE